jgi:phosphinothricin acetyltransferase
VARELPPASIPTRILVVDAMPRTPNGKLDRAHLAQMTSTKDRGVNGGIVAKPGLMQARTDIDIERRIAEIWCSELEVDQVGADQDFFALGGTSLTAVAVISRVRSELKVLVPLVALFRAPTVRALATTVIDLRDGSVGDERRALSTVVVRPVQGRDLPDICALVNHYIEHTTSNFRNKPQTPNEWNGYWSSARTSYPWLIATFDGVVVGVAYAGRWKDRSAYDWCAEVTVYVAHDMQHAGIGRALYEELLAMLDSQGYCTQIAAITLPNAASVAFHEALGFRHAGTLDGVGYKHGRWLDVGFWQRGQPQRDRPPPPTGLIATE